MNRLPFLPASESARTVIVANGQYPSHVLPLRMIAACNFVVCCDGAARELLDHGITPSAIVGDCDSIDDDLRMEYASIIRVDSDQQTNDLTKAVKFCMEQERYMLTIVGATGKREDHTLGNISLLASYAFCAEVSLDVVMVSDYGVFTPFNGDTCFESFAGQQVSIFGLDGVTSVTLEGLRYPLYNEPLRWWWQGTLNESLGDEFVIKADGKGIVFRTFADAI